MSESRQREEWTHTSHLLSIISNTFGGSKSEPADFFPFDQNKRRREIVMENPLGIDLLKIFLPK